MDSSEFTHEFTKDTSLPRTGVAALDKELRGCIILSKEAFNELHTEWRFCSNAKRKAELQEILMQSNLRLVFSIAKRRYTANTFPLLDAFQAGCLGLLRSLHKFRADRGNTITTYATYWIKQTIDREKYASDLARLPVHLWENFRKINSVKRKIRFELKRTATTEEIARVLSVSTARVLQLEHLEKMHAHISLSSPVGDGISELADILPHPNSVIRIESSGGDEHLAKLIVQVIKNLDRKEKLIVEKRVFHEFFGHEAWSLERIGDRMGVSRERVRQIEATALEKLRRVADQLRKKYSQV